MSEPTETPLRERLARLGPLDSENGYLYAGGTIGGRPWHVGCVFNGLPDVPAPELAALIAKLLNEYVETSAAS